MGDEEQQINNTGESGTAASEAGQDYDFPIVSSIDDLPDDIEDEPADSQGASSRAEDTIPVEDATPGGAVPSISAAVLQEYESKIGALTQELEALKAQFEERSAQYARLSADFDNFRKRTSKEREEQEERVICATVTEMLPVVDNFERARSQIKPQTESEMTIHKSYQGVYKQLVDCLKRLGVSPMRAEGVMFDPNLHNAVMREQTGEHEEGMVLEELMRGYVLGDRVLRHAMVKVAAPPDPVIPSDEGSEASED